MSERTVPAAHARRNVIITAAIAGLAGLLFGYDTGIIAGALLTIQPEFSLGSFASGMVVGAVPVGAVFGAWFASGRSDRYGRRSLILISAAVFIIGAIFVVQRTGNFVLVASVIAGQMIGALAADKFGMWGLPQVEINATKLAAVGLVLAGALVFHLSE